MTDITMILSLVSVGLAIAGFAAGRLSASRDRGHVDGQTQAKLDSIDDGIKQVNRRLDKLDEQSRNTIRDVAKLEARIDALEARRDA